MKVKINGLECDVHLAQYLRSGTAIQLFHDGEPYMTASSYIEGLDRDEVAIKIYSENTGILEALIDANIIYPPHRKIGMFPIVKLVQHEQE